MEDGHSMADGFFGPSFSTLKRWQQFVCLQDWRCHLSEGTESLSCAKVPQEHPGAVWQQGAKTQSS
jgi:hypothetical protein